MRARGVDLTRQEARGEGERWERKCRGSGEGGAYGSGYGEVRKGKKLQEVAGDRGDGGLVERVGKGILEKKRGFDGFAQTSPSNMCKL
ncbi:hypothetical protein ACH5RR_039642 [Cinchona calisaya]|uniref:Uncharacterized protein n=1 Tax=Cinchona calisaya TaxID=153742 RepID=A0ABD2XYV4_9GENT